MIYENSQDRERIIQILQNHGLLCISEEEVCDLSARGAGCNCGNIMKEIRDQ
jgi:hypothetical protein